jgi:hypothetical protein
VPRTRRLGPWDWIAERANEGDSLSLLESRLVLPLHEFDIYLDGVLGQFQELPSFQPLVTYIDGIRQGLEEGISWVQEYVAGDLEYGELQERLREDTAEGLESLLDSRPSLLRRVPRELPKEVERLLDDTQSFVDGICDEISRRGYDLHGYLTGAA